MDYMTTAIPKILGDNKPSDVNLLARKIAVESSEAMIKLSDEHLRINGTKWSCFVYFGPQGFVVETFPLNENAEFAYKKIWNTHCQHEIGDDK
jgi:hypothetical protein